MKKQSKIRTAILLVCTAILLVPLIAMQFTNEVQWSLSDFAIAGVLLFGSGLLLELVFRKTKPDKIRTIAVGTLIVLLILIIAELGVGIFGTPFAGN